MLLGIDTGGTFTDFVYLDEGGLRFHKVLSTPNDPSLAIMQGIEELRLEPGSLHLVHGCTVATNAILERKGVKTLFVTNKGLEDLIFIGRQTRQALYELCPLPSPGLLAEQDCVGISGRLDAAGRWIKEVDEDELQIIREKAEAYEAVAVCTLFSFLNPEQEQLVAGILPDTLPVSLSSEVLAEYREYERATTTFLNAYVGPMVAKYLVKLATTLQPEHLLIMHSAGGVMSAEEAGSQSVRMILSGPAGGLVAAQVIGEQLDINRMMTFDMGGTSTDVSLIDGNARTTTEAHIADLPVAVPMLDIHTIGAGGGSLAWRDTAGLLQVGPESSGADPGPVCYRRGGTTPTVTDANVILGRIPHSTMLAGNMSLDVEAARSAMQNMAQQFGISIGELALGIVRVAEENMAGALRVVSVQRGYDPRQFALVCFGGAGGLHACSLADRLEIPRVIFPLASGAFSAFGMLAGRRQGDFSRSRKMKLLDPSTLDVVDRLYVELEQQAAARMPNLKLSFQRYVDLRYEGQGFHLTLPFNDRPDDLKSAFDQAHEMAYGHILDQTVEIMTVRLTAFVDSPALELPALHQAVDPIRSVGESQVHGNGKVPHYRRTDLRPGHELQGPVLVLEDTSTLWLPGSWKLQVSDHGHLLLTHKDKKHS